MKLAKLPNGEPEIFHTLQGEGLNLGLPAVFIRSSLCNLHCVWCDTDHTWNFEGTPWTHEKDTHTDYEKFSKSECIIDMKISEIADRVRAFSCEHLVLTGGEPLLHMEDWFYLLSELGPSYTTEVETNGTIVPSDQFARYVHQWNVSPKLSGSGNAGHLRLKKDALDFFTADPRSVFKFVITNEDDFAEMEALIDKFFISRDTVLLMPEGRTKAGQDESKLWLAEKCIKSGYRFTPRLHIDLWGDKRGV